MSQIHSYMFSNIAPIKRTGLSLRLPYLPKWIPPPLFIANQKQHEQEQVMCNHARPGGNQSHMEEARTNKSSHNAYHPHAHNIVHEWTLCLAYALHHSFHNNGEAVERFRYRHHPKHRSSEANDLLRIGENSHQRRCRKE